MRFWRIRCSSVIRKSLIFSAFFILFILWRSLHNKGVEEVTLLRTSVPFPMKSCHRVSTTNHSLHLNTVLPTMFNESKIKNKRVLILTRRGSSVVKELLVILEANRILFEIHHLTGTTDDLLPSFTEAEIGKYCAILFTCFTDYFNLNSWNKQLLNSYCKSFSIGLVLFNQGDLKSVETHADLPFKIYTHTRQFKSYAINKNATLLHITKPGNILEADELSSHSKWSVFIPYNQAFLKHFDVVSMSSFIKPSPRDISWNVSGFPHNKDLLPVIIHDLGHQDGIQRVYFGSDLSFWLHKVLLLDALGSVSEHRLTKSLDRWLQIDIDDIFVGKSGIRLKPEDVEALVVTQEKFQKIIPGFHFNLGYSGKYYQHGNAKENEGDEKLVENAHKFWWFDHTWGHKQPHLVDNFDDLKDEVLLNLQFAKEHNIPVNKEYTVCPHHSGVYPVHDLIYKVWNKVSGVKVTSTEEYPHLRPWWKRRGFVYKNVMVLPRQTCGLFTHTIFLNEYPNGKATLLKSIYGGELFQLFINNPINIFMTHLSNYGNDRLALYTFSNVIKFVQCWTNVRILSRPPIELGNKYFELWPEEQDPIWQNPCQDRRHSDIWPAHKSCDRLPSLIIVGPQKSGTTALYMFLSAHPQLVHNKGNDRTYEETQFFSSINYHQGLDWYMKLFPSVSNKSSYLVFEKSANYFDSNKAAMRASALIPNAKIIVILIDPVKRAYSWYQHQRFHYDEIALNMNLYDILTYDNSSELVYSLLKRILVPGLYAQHLERWLMYYTSSQILLVDGDQLREDPIDVMNEVQEFLKVKTIIDYEKRLRYNRHKGFYCLVRKSGHADCLGRSKGRKYSPIDAKSEAYLRHYYQEPNRQLAELLHKIRKPIPRWLSKEVAN